MPPPPKIHCQEILQNPAARLILPNSVPNSAEGLSGPAQNVSVSQATTVTTSENTDVNLAKSIVQILLQNNETISDLFQKLDSGLEQFTAQYFLAFH